MMPRRDHGLYEKMVLLPHDLYLDMKRTFDEVKKQKELKRKETMNELRKKPKIGQVEAEESDEERLEKRPVQETPTKKEIVKKSALMQRKKRDAFSELTESRAPFMTSAMSESKLSGHKFVQARLDQLRGKNKTTPSAPSLTPSLPSDNHIHHLERVNGLRQKDAVEVTKDARPKLDDVEKKAATRRKRFPAAADHSRPDSHNELMNHKRSIKAPKLNRVEVEKMNKNSKKEAENEKRTHLHQARSLQPMIWSRVDLRPSTTRFSKKQKSTSLTANYEKRMKRDVAKRRFDTDDHRAFGSKIRKIDPPSLAASVANRHANDALHAKNRSAKPKKQTHANLASVVSGKRRRPDDDDDKNSVIDQRVEKRPKTRHIPNMKRKRIIHDNLFLHPSKFQRIDNPQMTQQQVDSHIPIDNTHLHPATESRVPKKKRTWADANPEMVVTPDQERRLDENETGIPYKVTLRDASQPRLW